MNNKPFKQLVLESWKYDGFEKAKEDKEEQLIDLGGTDTDFTPRRNLGAFFVSLHLTLPKKRLHRDEVLEPLEGYNAMLKHLYLTEYQRAMFKEFTSLLDCGTFEYKEHLDEKLVPLMWVFTNKFDEDGFLINFKARLMTRGDLYKSEDETYAVTLVA
jgi:hypothetical protein